MNLNALKEPFKESDIEWRVGQAGSTNGKPWAMVLAYISARAVQDRLDQVIGAENWKVEYRFLDKAVVASLAIKINEEWVAKEDVSEFTEIEPIKGGVSGALKRAASLWGVGRYLYDLTENFAKVVEKGTKDSKYAKTKDGTVFYWIPPSLPVWALPKGAKVTEQTITVTPASSTVPAKVEVISINVPEIKVDIASNNTTSTNIMEVKPRSTFKKPSETKIVSNQW